jgi:hypothetical protein
MCNVTRWAIFLGALALSITALELSAQTEDVRTRMAAVLRYTGLGNPAPSDVARMADLWTRAQQPGDDREGRLQAFRDMYLLYGTLHGRDFRDRPHAVDGLAQAALTTFEGGGRMDLALPEPRGTPAGTYLHLETRGHGPMPVLLISDVGVDGRKLYDSLAERQGGPYTMHIATLPYAGGARALP